MYLLLKQILKEDFMKKLSYIIGFMYVSMFIILMVLSSCTPAEKKQDPKVKRTIHGIAATGAVIEEGAAVEVRPAAVDGVPSDIIVATVGADGSYVVEIPESVPEISESGVITKSFSILKSSVPQNGTGFIIRVYSASAGSWLYSYSENDGVDTVANVNPYTDKIIRTFYSQMNNDAYPFIYAYDQNIDNIFPSGIFSDGATAINVPEKEIIDQVMTVMSNMLKDTYGLSDIQNALIDTWEIGVGLDRLLDLAVGTRLKMWLQNEFSYLYQNPYALISSNVYEDDYSPTVNTIHVDIWTAYGNTGNVTVLGTWQTPWTDTVMVKQADSVEGNNHYSLTLTFEDPYDHDNIALVIDDYNPTSSVPVALKRY